MKSKASLCRQLLLQLSTIFGGNDLETVLSLKRLNPKQELSETISQHAGLSEKATLSHIVQGLQRTLEFLPTCHDISHVNYIWQVRNSKSQTEGSCN